MADGINTARVGSVYFGPAAVTAHVAITQQSQWFFGQSWPSLIFLPYISRSSTRTTDSDIGSARAREGLRRPRSARTSSPTSGGDISSAGTRYRDQWLSEGFAEFTAALVLEYHGAAEAGGDEFWDKAGKEHPREARPARTSPNDEAGPDLARAGGSSTWRNPVRGVRR